MDAIRLFSTPFEGNFPQAAKQLALLQFQLMCKKLLEYDDSDIDEADRNTVSEIYDSLSMIEPSTRFFCPEMGLAYLVLANEPIDRGTYNWISCQLLIAALLRGIVPAIEKKLSVDRPFYVAGRSVPAAAMEITGDSNQLTFYLSDDGRRQPVEFRKISDDGNNPIWAKTDCDLCTIPWGSASQVSISGGHDGWTLDSERDHTPVENPSFFAQQYEDTGSLLEEISTEYYLWTAFVLENIVPVVRLDEMTIGSSSNFFVPRVSQITSPAAISETAEMLVHECSHQYFNLALRFGLMKQPDAPDCYSPLTQSKRPLDRILVGYHAFGNVLLLYRQFKDAGIPALPARLETTSESMVVLGDTLSREYEDGLTEFGKALYLPLRDRLREYDLLSTH